MNTHPLDGVAHSSQFPALLETLAQASGPEQAIALWWTYFLAGELQRPQESSELPEMAGPR